MHVPRRQDRHKALSLQDAGRCLVSVVTVHQETGRGGVDEDG